MLGPVRRVGEQITELFAHPGGRAARPMAHVLNFFNRRGNQRAAGAVGIRPGHRVLEVGFGGGAAFPTTLGVLDSVGMLCGIDLSPDMAALAVRRFKTPVEAGLLVVACADVGALPLPAKTFDEAYALHSHMYWPSPLAGISELHRVLRAGGRLLLAMDVVSGVRLIKWFGRGYEPARPACRAPARWDHPSASDMGPALGVINVDDVMIASLSAPGQGLRRTC